VGIWRKSQGNQTEIHGVADTGKKYFTPNHNLKRNHKETRQIQGVTDEKLNSHVVIIWKNSTEQSPS
jgi:hypothetical protein